MRRRQERRDLRFVIRPEGIEYRKIYHALGWISAVHPLPYQALLFRFSLIVANRDYVRRGSSSKKGSPKKAANHRPWKSGLVAVVLVIVFGYGLYELSHSSGHSETKPAHKTAESHAVNAVKPAVKSPVKKEVLPPPPTEKWDYVDTLPNRQIKVKPKDLPVSQIPYVMQCGAYKTMRQAESRKAQIAFQGLMSKIRKKEDSSWYRVVLGPYKFKRDAVRDQHKLQRAKIEPCAIWKDNQ